MYVVLYLSDLDGVLDGARAGGLEELAAVGHGHQALEVQLLYTTTHKTKTRRCEHLLCGTSLPRGTSSVWWRVHQLNESGDVWSYLAVDDLGLSGDGRLAVAVQHGQEGTLAVHGSLSS